MATVLVGKAPLTTIRHTNGSRSNLARGAIVPASIDKADAARLLEEDYLEEIEIVEPEADADVDPDTDEKSEPTTIPEIEAVVGDDPEKAQTFLEAEMAKPKPRPSLVTKLEAVIDAAEKKAAAEAAGGGDD